MFGFFKKRKTVESDRSGSPVIAALLIEDESFPLEGLAARLQKKKFQGNAVRELSHDGGPILTLRVGDELIAIAHMPAPYPASDILGPIETTWLWPSEPSIEGLKKHKSHVLVTLIGGAKDCIQRRLLLTSIMVEVLKETGVAAAFWAEASLVIHPDIFVDMAEAFPSPEAPPIYLWVDMRAYQNQDGSTCMFTAGLASLGHMEIEIPRIEMAPGELRALLLNIIVYLLEKGPVFRDGETIGMTAEQRIRIRHCKSKFGHAGKVVCLEP